MIQKIQVNKKLAVLETMIRDRETGCAQLRNALLALGNTFGEEILYDRSTIPFNVTTPLSRKFSGKKLRHPEGESVIISTKDDYEYFARGIAEAFTSTYRGWINFEGARGKDVFSSPVRDIRLPAIKSGQSVQQVIIAKSVIASGCTAISLAKRAYEEYMPRELIIVAPFYSMQGANELQAELKNAEIYVAFGPDKIDSAGFLVPGVGNIDARLAECG